MLPKLKMKFMLQDPSFVPEYSKNGTICTNFEKYEAEFEVEVEVVQLNLSSGGMRARFEWYDKYAKKGTSIRSIDVSNEAFFAKYDIVEK